MFPKPRRGGPFIARPQAFKRRERRESQRKGIGRVGQGGVWETDGVAEGWGLEASVGAGSINRPPLAGFGKRNSEPGVLYTGHP